MKVTARVAIDYEAEVVARAVEAAVAPENEGFVRSAVAGARLVADAEADSVLSILRTLDDYLAGLSVAEAAAREARAD